VSFRKTRGVPCPVASFCSRSARARAALAVRFFAALVCAGASSSAGAAGSGASSLRVGSGRASASSAEKLLREEGRVGTARFEPAARRSDSLRALMG
jgi:hypothetical protein